MGYAILGLIPIINYYVLIMIINNDISESKHHK